MKASAELATFMEGWERLETVAYKDGGGVWTIGIGRTKNVRPGDTCTEAQARAWYAEELDQYADELSPYCTRRPSQQQFDALLSLGYNAGIAPPTGIGRAGIISLFNSGDDQGCGDRFLLWNKDGGKVVRGLTKRREAERAIYLFGDYSGRP